MYDRFALIYDRVMRSVDYPTWAEYVLNLAQKYGFRTDRICDLACGTGTLALLLAERGSEVLGVDRSEAMLEEARRKQNEREDLSWLQGNLTDFELGGHFPLITCLYDSINYLLTEEEVLTCFRQVFRHLEPGGGFIFDITTEYNILTHFADYTFAENLDDCSYIWENSYNIRTKIIDSDVTIFSIEGDLYQRAQETHRQRIFTTRKMAELSREAGFELLGSFDGFSLDTPGPKVERVHFVCRRNK